MNAETSALITAAGRGEDLALPFRDAAEDRETFWSAYISFGFGVQMLEGAAALFYLLVFGGGAHKSSLVLLVVALLGFTVAGLPLSSLIARQAWRERFVLCSSLVAGLATFLCAALDGGVDSPIAYLLVLPIAYAAIALSASSVALVSFSGIGELAWLLVADTDLAHVEGKLMLEAAAVLGVAVVAMAASIARQRLWDAEDALRKRLAQMAETDATSGCLNAHGLRTRGEAEVDRAVRYGEELSLLIVDIDFFKYHNDTFGHANGDAVLADLGALLREESRASDIVGRIGGDEFAVVLASTGVEAAGEFANRLCTSIRAMPGSGITVSVGVANLKREEPTAKRLFKDADRSLYCAKAAGRDRVVLTTEAQTDGAPALRLSEDRDRVVDRLMQLTRDKRETLALLEALEASAPVGLCVTDTAYHVVRMNNAMAELVRDGASRLGAHLNEVLPQVWAELSSLQQDDIAAGHILLDNVAVTLSSGENRYFAFFAYPVKTDGRLSAVAIASLDVTDRRETEENQKRRLDLMLDTISALLDSRDPYTAGHLRRVADLACAIGRRMGLPDDEIEEINLSARIHDIGKIRVPTELLVRPGRLTVEELALVKQHAQIGHDILMQVECPDSVRRAVLEHHERLDGSGYPAGLEGGAISKLARIIAVADVVDAMQRDRPYREAPGRSAALEELAEGAGSRYDSDVVRACLDLLSGTGVDSFAGSLAI